MTATAPLNDVNGLIDRQLVARPGVRFLRWGEEDVTWSELAGQRDAHALALLARGVAAGDRVAVQCGTSPKLIYLLLAIWRLGAVAVLSNPANTSRELQVAVDLAGAGLTVVDAPELASELAVPTVELARLAGRPAGGELDGIARPSADAPASILFTSGSTATPKGVVLCHRHHRLAGEVVVRMLGLTEADAFLQFFPLFHMNGLGHVMGAMSAGCELILEPRYRTSEFREWVRSKRPTATAVNATHVKMLANDSHRLTPGESSLRTAQLGLSAMLSDELYDRFESEFGCTLIESYGLTESGALCSTSTAETRRRRSCGVPVRDYDLRIMGSGGHPAPAGATGVIEVRLRDPHGPLPVYLHDGGASSAGWFDTGDVGYLDDSGFLFWLEREKELIKRAGENIAPSEVELILESHPAVIEAVVVGVPDELREEIPWAWVIADGSDVGEEDLREFCGARLARFKVPEGIEFVSAFPRTGVGKIERKVVRTWRPSSGRSAGR